MKDLLGRLTKQGFSVEVANNGHYRVTAPCGRQKAQISSTPRDRRTVLNAITRLKRIGFDHRA